MTSKKVNFKPLGQQILVEPLEEGKTTASGLVIPDTVSREAPQQGKVIALGTGTVLENGDVVPFVVKVGDKVLFKKYASAEIKIDEIDYLIMEEDDILGIME